MQSSQFSTFSSFLGIHLLHTDYYIFSDDWNTDNSRSNASVNLALPFVSLPFSRRTTKKASSDWRPEPRNISTCNRSTRSNTKSTNQPSTPVKNAANTRTVCFSILDTIFYAFRDSFSKGSRSLDRCFLFTIYILYTDFTNFALL